MRSVRYLSIWCLTHPVEHAAAKKKLKEELDAEKAAKNQKRLEELEAKAKAKRDTAPKNHLLTALQAMTGDSSTP